MKGDPNQAGLEEEKRVDEQNDEDDHPGGPVFSPPLYLQRYLLVTDMLREEGVKSVADFGCAECKLLKYMKNIESIEHMIGVDIDLELLKKHRWKLKPLTYEYISKRSNPLKVQLYHGSITELDSRLSGVQACVMMEIIEHLELSDLDLVPDVVFGLMQPHLVLVTTPNSEYNVCFPNFSGYRHWDHKFEWTRHHFQNWCDMVSRKFNYTVSFTGVGLPPEDRQEVGFCSQIAVFRRNKQIFSESVSQVERYLDPKHKEMVSEPHNSITQDGNNPADMMHRELDVWTKGLNSATKECPYSLVEEYVYPHKEKLSWEEELKLEAEYYLRLLARDADTSDEDKTAVELCKLSSFRKVHQLCPDQAALRDFLLGLGYRFSEDQQSVLLDTDDPWKYKLYSYEHENDERNSTCSEEHVNGYTWTTNCETEEGYWDMPEPPSSQSQQISFVMSDGDTVVCGQFDDPEDWDVS